MTFSPEFDPKTGVPRTPSRATADLLAPPRAVPANMALTYAKGALSTTKQSLIRLQHLTVKAEADFRKARQAVHQEEEEISESDTEEASQTAEITLASSHGSPTTKGSLIDAPITPQSPTSSRHERNGSTSSDSSDFDGYTGVTSPTFSSPTTSASTPKIIISPPASDRPLATTSPSKANTMDNKAPREPWSARASRRPHADNVPKGPRAMTSGRTPSVLFQTTRGMRSSTVNPNAHVSLPVTGSRRPTSFENGRGYQR